MKFPTGVVVPYQAEVTLSSILRLGYFFDESKIY